MDANLRELLERHHVAVAQDNAFQRKARLLQALWREARDLPMGEHRGRALGSRLAMPAAKDDLSNYLTDGIRDVVRREVIDPVGRRDKLYGQPRIFNDLLSSQPLCFNLFGELQRDLALATRAFGTLAAGRIAEVTAIRFEHSPGRRDAKYTGDRSAFDVFVEYTTPRRTRGFVGIEVKYHEALEDRAAPHRERYSEIAAAMGAFKPTRFGRLQARPLQQIWRDHLLAGSLLADRGAGFDDGFFVFLSPRGNACCAEALEGYRACLADTHTKTFDAWSLEDVAAAIKTAGAGPWIDAFADRYLAFQKVEALLAKQRVRSVDR